MLSYDLKVGSALQIGDVACIAFDAKTGNRIKVRIGNPQRLPITLIPSGIIPSYFATGITGQSAPPRAGRVAVAATA